MLLPAWGERTQIEDVAGLLEREGQGTASIEEMKEAVAEQAAEEPKMTSASRTIESTKNSA